MGTYQAKSRSQDEPGDLYQGPRPVANHVLNVVIETVCPCPGTVGEEGEQKGGDSSWVFGKDSLGSSSPDSMNEMGPWHPRHCAGSWGGRRSCHQQARGPGVTQTLGAVSVPLSLGEDSTVLTTEEGESLQWGSVLYIQMLVYPHSKDEFGFKSKHKTASAHCSSRSFPL